MSNTIATSNRFSHLTDAELEKQIESVWKQIYCVQDSAGSTILGSVEYFTAIENEKKRESLLHKEHADLCWERRCRGLRSI